MTDIKQFILNKLPELVLCNEQPQVLGSLGFATTYDRLHGKINPFHLYLPGPLTEKVTDNKKIFVSVINESLQSVFTKRIKNTPFYISYFNGDGLAVYMLDYYAWSPQTVIYRLMHVGFTDKNMPFVCRFPDSEKTEKENIFRSTDYFYSWHTMADSSFVGGELTIFPADGLSSLSLLTAISTDADALSMTSVETALETYYKLESRVQSGHIKQLIKTQNKSFEIKLDTAWAQIKGLTPDLQMDPYLLKNKERINVTARWTEEICRVLGLDQLHEKVDLQNEPGINQLPNPSGHVEFYTNISRAYHKNNMPTDRIIAMLQAWWNRYSRPVFEIKLREMVDHETEFLFIIYALAQRYRLIWSDNLLGKCNYFKHLPELHLLAHLYRLMVIKSSDGLSQQVNRGNFPAGNLIQIKQRAYTYRYSTYGKKKYSEIRKDQVQICKIDKEVNFELIDLKKIVQILPSVIPLNEKVLKENNLIIEINGQRLQIPMAWSQGTVDFHNFRIRWLLKKDCFQLTCKAGKFVKTIQINGEPVETDHSRRIKFKLPVKKSPVQTGLFLADSLGRTSLLQTHSSTQNVILSGWIQDRYKIFISHFNLISNGKQWIGTGEESGKVECLVGLSSLTSQLNLVFKKYRESLDIKWINDQNLAGFLSYSPERDKGCLLVLLSKSLKNEIHWIKNRLKKDLGFMPVLVVLSDTHLVHTSGPLLLLVKIGEDELIIQKNLKPLTIGIDQKNEDFFSGIVPLIEKIRDN